MRARVGSVVALLVGAACSGGADAHDSGAAGAQPPDSHTIAPATAPRPAKRTIVFMGTSLTAGYGLADPDSAFPAVIARRIDSLGVSYDVVNAGVSGETSAGAVRRIDWVARSPMDVLVLETGANDGLRALSVDSMKANIESIVAHARRAHPGVTIVLAGMQAPPNLGARYTNDFRAAFPALARRDSLVLIPFLLDGVAGVPSLNQADGIHPNPDGARRVADTVWKVLAPLLTAAPKAAAGVGMRHGH